MFVGNMKLCGVCRRNSQACNQYNKQHDKHDKLIDFESVLSLGTQTDEFNVKLALTINGYFNGHNIDLYLLKI